MGKIKPWVYPVAALLLVIIVFMLISFRVAAFAGGKIITPAALELRLRVIQFSYDLQFGQTPNYEPDFARQNKRQVLDQLAEEHLLLQVADELASIEERQEYADQLIDWLQNNLFADDQSGYEAILAKHQLSEAELAAYFGNNLLLTRLHSREIAEITVSDDEILEFYEENRASFNQPELIKVAHILVAEQAMAEQLRERLTQGDDFAFLANKHSLDTESANYGGSLQWFSRGQMEASFEAAAFALEPGQTSPVIATSRGYHIIRMEAKDPAKEQTFDQVSKQVAERALIAKQDAAWNAYRQEIRGRKLILLFVR